MAKEYDLDVQLEHDEVNHKLAFVGGKRISPDVNYAQIFPASSATTNYQNLLELMLCEQRD